MRVLFNALKVDEGPPSHVLSGNYYHTHYLAEALSSRHELDLIVLSDEHTHESLSTVIPLNNLCRVELNGGGVMAADHAVARSVRRLKPDLYHRPTGQLPLRPMSIPTVATIADLHHYLVFPTPLLKKIYKHVSYCWTMHAATEITCISEYTRQEVIRHFGVPARKVTVIHHGANPLPPADESVSRSIDGGFWLAFGHQCYKNVEAAIRAMRQRPDQERLVVVGTGSYIENILKPLAAKALVPDRVLFPGYVSRAQLHGLLQRSIGLLFLSTHEGFGLPVLEAMFAGCPVISSNRCSLPEVVGKAGKLVSPSDQDQIGRAMGSLTGDSVERQSLISLGLENAARFTWEDAAEKTLHVYRKALEKSTRQP